MSPHRLDLTTATTIARDLQLPLEHVQQVYAEEFAALAKEARVTQFIDVLAHHKARLRLRRTKGRAAH